MKPPFYEKVHQLAVDMVNASEANNQRSFWKSYQQLEELCEHAEFSSQNHPFLWETLADFTNDYRIALHLYKKGLQSAESLQLEDYKASILLSMAQNHSVIGQKDIADKLANEAYGLAKAINDSEFIEEISEFLVELHDAT